MLSYDTKHKIQLLQWLSPCYFMNTSDKNKYCVGQNGGAYIVWEPSFKRLLVFFSLLDTKSGGGVREISPEHC